MKKIARHPAMRVLKRMAANAPWVDNLRTIH
jgi:hypothetical protein